MEQDIQPVKESKTAPAFNDSVACDVCGYSEERIEANQIIPATGTSHTD